MIKTVKEFNSGNSYKVTMENGAKIDSVPKAHGNIDYEAIKKFIANGGTVEAEFTVEQLQIIKIAHFKSLYLGVVNDKLDELDYDSLATVKLWEGDGTFGAEASKILVWYKSIILYSYGLITTGTIPTDDEYLAGIPVYV